MQTTIAIINAGVRQDSPLKPLPITITALVPVYDDLGLEYKPAHAGDGNYSLSVSEQVDITLTYDEVFFRTGFFLEFYQPDLNQWGAIFFAQSTNGDQQLFTVNQSNFNYDPEYVDEQLTKITISIID